jgi:hypothetical protein
MTPPRLWGSARVNIKVPRGSGSNGGAGEGADRRGDDDGAVAAFNAFRTWMKRPDQKSFDLTG